MIPPLKRFSLLILCACLAAGCGERANPRYTYTDAEKKFIATLNQQYGLTPLVQRVGNTVWVYLPLDDDIFEYKATEQHAAAGDIQQKLGVHLLESGLENGTLTLQFDIAKDFTKPKDRGYKTGYKDAFLTTITRVYGAIKGCFFDLNDLPGERHFIDQAKDAERTRMLENYVPKPEAPEFFALMFCNVKTGMVAKKIFYLKDFMGYQAGTLPMEEYNLREINEFYGDSSMVGDPAGRKLKTTPIAWTWFLPEQIKNRVRFVLEASETPPGDDYIGAILQQIGLTMRYYNFRDFSAVHLKDLRAGKDYLFNKNQLQSFQK